MRLRLIVVPVLVDASIAIALGAGWPVRWGDCAPTGPGCRLSACLQVCTGSQGRFLDVALYGAVIGLFPAGLAAIGLLQLETIAPGRERALRYVLLTLTLIVMVLTAVLTFLWWGPFADLFEAGVVLVVALAIFFASIYDAGPEEPPPEFTG